MHLDGENDRVRRRRERCVANRLDDVSEENLGGEGVAVEDDGFFGSVPAVKLNTATARVENKAVHLDRRLPLELVARQVCVMRRVDPVVAQRKVHVLVRSQTVRHEHAIDRRIQVASEASLAHSISGLIVVEVADHLRNLVRGQVFLLNLSHEQAQSLCIKFCGCGRDGVDELHKFVTMLQIFNKRLELFEVELSVVVRVVFHYKFLALRLIVRSNVHPIQHALHL
mmetsp:Transcript_13572/g.32102  ORF Transcript_13572/g.32102 Transcript_13572/m.32102 type:complete len:226 (+) Transcript_13572:1077-1754(+)